MRQFRYFITIFLAVFGFTGMFQMMVTAQAVTPDSHVVMEQQTTSTQQPEVQVVNVPTPPATANPMYNLIIYIVSSLTALVLTVLQYYNNRQRYQHDTQMRIDRERRTS